MMKSENNKSECPSRSLEIATTGGSDARYGYIFIRPFTKVQANN